MLKGVLIDEVVELGFDLAGHFSRSAATGAVKKAAGWGGKWRMIRGHAEEIHVALC